MCVFVSPCLHANEGLFLYYHIWRDYTTGSLFHYSHTPLHLIPSKLQILYLPQSAGHLSMELYTVFEYLKVARSFAPSSGGESDVWPVSVSPTVGVCCCCVSGESYNTPQHGSTSYGCPLLLPYGGPFPDRPTLSFNFD